MSASGPTAVPSPAAVPGPGYLLDANMLLRRAEPTHHLHGAAIAAVQTLVRSRSRLCLAPQCLYEFWAVATRPVTARGLGLTGNETLGFVVQFKGVFDLLPDNAATYPEWERLVTQYGVSGKPTHDTRLVAFMLAHQLTHLLTFNVGDFTRYTAEGIVVVDPATLLAGTP